MLEEDFLRKLDVGGAKLDLLILTKNRDTRDDMREALALGVTRNVRRMVFVTVSVHLARAKEFMNLALKEVRKNDAPSFIFQTSEEVLARRYAGFSQAESTIKRALASAAYRRTSTVEQRGIDALRSGTYRFKVTLLKRYR